MTELWKYGANELAGMIARREVSSREVVDAHLDRIEAVNPEINAVVRVLADSARSAADAADRAVRSGERLGALHGVPCTVKENIDLAGTPTTQGLVALRDAVAPVDAPVVERMRAAGAIPIGRTNLPDLGLRVHTDSELHGLTRNPWNLDRTVGGSSGGEGAALASGMSPIGLGNDIGGSLRNPAHCCGVASIKPTTGVVPHATVIPPEDGGISSQFMLVEGVMARRVDDVRTGLLAVAGAHWRDPVSVPAVLTDLAPGATCRVALLPEPPGGSTHPGIAAAVRAAGAALAERGHTVVEATPPSYERVLDLWANLLGLDLRNQLPLLEMVMGADGKQFLVQGIDGFAVLDLPSALNQFAERQRHQREWAEWFEGFDALISPIWAQPPFHHGYDIESPEAGAAVLDLLRPVKPANYLGLPGACVPAGMVEGLPVAVQVMGPAFTDLRCLALAGQIEAALGLATPIDPRR
jgi:amidase